ncbi:succinylglutamate desuccinylase/aspartoacylase domain-containing protein [Membranihabitans marinus]|uniref:succinylglutamate desuccinylase/aspartoacylase domain-containing protein n=1 Tax=Membranihabitans marinus TaxID=1227546 RepID=UPI001F1ED383|nr:succinylglutamate desuccinylase/aspartoacylase family protein [Membranihabitans marinus]
MMTDDRLIGIFDEGHPGPLVIMIGAIHGNETAGLKALDLLLKMLEVEYITNTSFVFKGRLVAIKGNIDAINQSKRYIKKDLNRQFREEWIENWSRSTDLQYEEKQAVELVNFIKSMIESYNPTEVFILDLHTTTATGGIFTLVTDDAESIQWGLELHAPVIEGFLDGISGTVLHYFNTKNLQRPTATLCFEAGQHDDVLSVNRAIAAAVNYLSAIGCVERFHIETQHNKILNQYAKGLPTHCRLLYNHEIKENDGFKMLPGFKNFDPIVKGQVLASDHEGDISALSSGRILMPHYQEQGEDGFFIIEDLSDELIS